MLYVTVTIHVHTQTDTLGMLKGGGVYSAIFFKPHNEVRMSFQDREIVVVLWARCFMMGVNENVPRFCLIVRHSQSDELCLT